MSESTRDSGDLRREIIEARNQAIKTDNQVKNLALDIKGLDRRFEFLEKRMRFSSVGVNVIVALTVGIAAYTIDASRQSNQASEIDALTSEASEARRAGETKSGELRQRLASIEEENRERVKHEQLAVELLEHLDAKREREALEWVEKLDLKKIGPAAQKLVGKRVQEFQKQIAETSYKNGKANLTAKKESAAVAEFRRCLRVEPEGRYATSARYLLMSALLTLKNYSEAETLLREILAKDNDRAVLDEARYLLGVALAGQDKKDAARAQLKEVATSGSRYASNAKNYLASLDVPPTPAPTAVSDTPATAAKPQ